MDLVDLFVDLLGLGSDVARLY